MITFTLRNIVQQNTIYLCMQHSNMHSKHQKCCDVITHIYAKAAQLLSLYFCFRWYDKETDEWEFQNEIKLRLKV